MFGFGHKTCWLCGNRVQRRLVYRAPDRMNSFVCRACVERWNRTGRRCEECQTAVTGVQEIGVFFERGALGHADCGGVRLFAA